MGVYDCELVQFFPSIRVTNPWFAVDTSPNPAKMQVSSIIISDDRKSMENTQNIDLTPEAAIAVKTLLKEQDIDTHSLRIFIAGVGWGGPQYGLSLDDTVSDSDQVYSSHGVQVIVDGQTLAYLQKATIKFVEENGQRGFQVEQLAPNTALSGCAGCDPATGCG